MIATPAAESAAAWQPARSAEPDGRLPIVIGVTGHRHLRAGDLPAHRGQVRELFAGLRRRYPNTPLRIVTALAEGADRLVAQVALDDGHELLVPLPLEPADYERDFPESTAQFHSILRRIPPEQVFVLPRDPGPDHEQPTSQEKREKCYRAVGMFLAQQSHLLLALWDGRSNASGAGTAAVVNMKLEGPAGLPEAGLRPLDVDDGGPVYHIHAPRDGEPAAHSVKKPEWLFPQDGDEALFHTLCSRIERFNSEPLRRSMASRLPQAAQALLPDISSRSRSARTLANAFAAADLLARHYQRITRVVLRLTLLFAALLALIFEIYAEVLPWRALPAGYLAAFASLTGILLWQGQRDVQGRYLDYRALAEGLRVQFYWRLAGLPDSASSSYLRKQLDELRWIREALRAAAALPPPQAAHPRARIGALGWRPGHLLRGSRAVAAQAPASPRAELAALPWRGAARHRDLVVFWKRLESSPALAPLARGPHGLRADRRRALGDLCRAPGPAHPGQSVRALRGHLPSRRAASPSSSSATQRATTGITRSIALLRELGREALMENGDWVLLLRERPIVLPKG